MSEKCGFQCGSKVNLPSDTADLFVENKISAIQPAPHDIGHAIGEDFSEEIDDRNAFEWLNRNDVAFFQLVPSIAEKIIDILNGDSLDGHFKRALMALSDFSGLSNQYSLMSGAIS